MRFEALPLPAAAIQAWTATGSDLRPWLLLVIFVASHSLNSIMLGLYFLAASVRLGDPVRGICIAIALLMLAAFTGIFVGVACFGPAYGFVHAKTYTTQLFVYVNALVALSILVAVHADAWLTGSALLVVIGVAGQQFLAFLSGISGSSPWEAHIRRAPQLRSHCAVCAGRRRTRAGKRAAAAVLGAPACGALQSCCIAAACIVAQHSHCCRLQSCRCERRIMTCWQVQGGAYV